MIHAKYEINSSTFILMPTKKNYCHVVDENGSYVIRKSAFEIIKDACYYFGNSFESRHLMTKRLINISYKSPIIIEESRAVIFFPTSSPREEKCIWLSLNTINKYIRNGNNTIIIFKNNKKIEIPVSYNIIDNQIARSIMLEKELNKRKKDF